MWTPKWGSHHWAQFLNGSQNLLSCSTLLVHFTCVSVCQCVLLNSSRYYFTGYKICHQAKVAIMLCFLYDQSYLYIYLHTLVYLPPYIGILTFIHWYAYLHTLVYLPPYIGILTSIHWYTYLHTLVYLPSYIGILIFIHWYTYLHTLVYLPPYIGILTFIHWYTYLHTLVYLPLCINIFTWANLLMVKTNLID